MDEEYDPTWALRCDGGNSEKRRQTFARLARRAVVALGLKVNNPFEALDTWLNRLHRFHWGLKTRFGGNHWCVSHLAEAAAEYSAELSTRFHEAENSDSEGKFSDLERQFRELEDPDAEFVAIRRRDTDLERDDYPFTSWLYDHAHETRLDPKMELEYWSDHIWGGYQGRIEHWDRLDRTGPAWAALPETLKDAAAGLSYDLAVLQANHAIDRGLRGDEAMRDFQAEADKLLGRVIEAVRVGWSRLGFSFDDGAGETRMLTEAFERVRDDLRKLLENLPPAASFQPVARPDGNTSVSLNDDREQSLAIVAGMQGADVQDVAVSGKPSDFAAGTPSIKVDLGFREDQFTLPDAPDELKKGVRLLAHGANYAETHNTSVPDGSVDGFLKRLRDYGYALDDMETILTSARDYLRARIVDMQATRRFTEASSLQFFADEFERLRATFFSDREGARCLADRSQASRAKARSEWLDRNRTAKGWTADTDIAENGGPSYNTIQRYRSGEESTRDPYVRAKLATAFGCKILEVPE